MGRTIPILMFHDLVDKPNSHISFSPRVFSTGLTRMVRRGWRSLPLDRIAEAVKSHNGFPDRTFGMSFDDGSVSIYEQVFPVLQELDFPASVFVLTGRRIPTDPAARLPDFEGRPMMSWAQVREMHEHGVTIGCHSMSHTDLSREPNTLRAEILEAKSELENFLGAPVTGFAYPYGLHTARIRKMTAQGYAYACAVGFNQVGPDSDPYALERIDAWHVRSALRFELLRSPLFKLFMRYQDGLRRLSLFLRCRMKHRV